ncbi:MAG: hypothetical protein JXM79_17345, partial [Sedimentisphaerales bacterium]|nr:hypothetical protein [Sedimentisphaerales bacterium]
GHYLLNKYNRSTSQASWFARWAGMIGIMDVGGFIALSLIYSTSSAGAVEEVVHAPQHELSTVSYIILGLVFLLIICGFGWCFYRALSAAGKDTGVQHPDEVGDENQQTTDERR